MADRKMITVDGNEAVALVAHRLSEVIAIYPITPSSPMGELSDEYSVKKMDNIWGTIPDVVEMQSEGGAIGAIHGALQAGSLTTTFTASQGLLLMIPNMYKIAGELSPFCMHVSARTLATHALSIFGDHSDVMSVRQTGFALLASGSVQEAHDLALVSHAATLKTRIPFLHFFDGFRTSHEVSKIEQLNEEDIASMIDEEAIRAIRDRALTPDRPKIRGTAQNPDTFFQSREAANTFYLDCPKAVQAMMDQFAAMTGRKYRLFDYVGHPEAERVIIMMGSGAEVAHEAIEHFVSQGEKVGLIKVRLYRPFSIGDFVGALPASVKAIAVLDRTKEPGAVGEPLYQDVRTAIGEAMEAGSFKGAKYPKIIGGRYGLSSKEFTPSMVKGVLDHLGSDAPKTHFTVGINDDVTHLSISWEKGLDVEPDSVKRALFYGLGSDGTVGANKNSIKILGEETDNFAQGYFVYDSKKAGAMTVSHLRFGPDQIRSSYLIGQAGFVACHHFPFVDRVDMLRNAAPGAVFLLNVPYAADKVWDELPKEVQEDIIKKKLKVYCIDAYEVAKAAGMGRRINTIMQTCYFAISGVLPRDEAIAQIKKAIDKTYSKKGQEIVKRNFAAVDMTLEHLHEVSVPEQVTATRVRPPIVSDQAPEFVRNVEGVMMANLGDDLPVSAFPVDGTWPVSTTKWEKRSLALEIPVWNPKICIQCNKCSIVCPHAAIRPKVYDPKYLENAPETFKSVDFRSKDMPGLKLTLQTAAEDCTGCALCVQACPAKDKADPKRKAVNMEPQMPLMEAERKNYEYFLSIPDPDRTKLKLDVKGTQLLRPLFEYSGACAGCGETSYVKLLSQLFGDRAMIANATGCSSIYGGNLPTTPYTTDDEGRGPTWANSLFEDNAEFGFGFRLAVDKHKGMAQELCKKLEGDIGGELVKGLVEAVQVTEADIKAQRDRVKVLKEKIKGIDKPEAKRLEMLADYLVKKSVWVLGGDGWAYDIGYGGLDHVLANGRNVNILVVDTEVYSNTGGQMSKATPMGASAKFAVAGRQLPKKDLGLIAMSYGHVYVASVAMGAKDLQVVKAFQEAESWDGPSIIIAYAHCIAHGYDLVNGLSQQQLAVNSGVWPLYRFDPRRVTEGKAPLQIDSPAPKVSPMEYMKNETRFKIAEKINPERFKALMEAAQMHSVKRYAVYQQLAGISVGNGNASGNGK